MSTSERSSRSEALSQLLVLLIDCSVDLTQVAEDTLGPHGVANRDLGLLLTVHRTPGLTPSLLADRLGLSRSVVSKALRRFQQGGLVRRDVDPSDHRLFRVTLTPKGRRRVAAFEANLGGWFASHAARVRDVLSLVEPEIPPESDKAAALAPLDVAAQLSRAGSAYVAEVVPALTAYGIGLATDRFAVSLIHAHGQLRPAQLGTALHLTSSGTSTMLDRLEEAGLINRLREPGHPDRRAVTLTLTPRGNQAADIALDTLDRHATGLCPALRLGTRLHLATGAA